MSVRRALLIANETFRDPRVPGLKSPSADAAALAELLRSPDVGDFDVDYLADASAREIRLAVERTFKEASPDDTVLLFLTGHGAPAASGFVFVPADCDPDWLEATCVSATFVRDMMNQSLPRQQIVILDCCFSGGFAEGFFAKVGTSAVAMAELRAEGRVVIASSSSIQESFEFARGGSWSSIFTRAIVDGIATGAADLDSDGTVSLRELYEHAYRSVIETNPAQTPVITEMNVLGDLPIAKIPLTSARLERVPPELVSALGSSYESIRTSGIREIGRLLQSSVDERGQAARRLLREVAKGDDPTLAAMAEALLQTRRRPRRRVRGTVAVRTGSEGEPWFTVEPGPFERAVRAVSVAISSDDYRPILKGVLVQVEGGVLRMVATDSYRLAVAEVSTAGREATALVDGRSLGSLKVKRRRTVRAYLDDRTMDLETGDVVIAVDRLDGMFPNYERLLPEVGSQAVCTVNTTELIVATEEVRDTGSERSPISLTFSSDQVEVSNVARNSQSRIVRAKFSGERIVIGLNPEYLIDGLQACQSPTAVVLPSRAKKPLLIWPETWDFRYLLMPVRI